MVVDNIPNEGYLFIAVTGILEAFARNKEGA